jgi:hypothetical protein
MRPGIRWERPLTYRYLIAILENNFSIFKCMNFARSLLDEEVKKAIKDTSYNKEFHFYHGNHDELEAFNKSGLINPLKMEVMNLQEDVIGKHIATFRRNAPSPTMFNISMFMGLEFAHFIRTKFINVIYEVLKKYLTRYDQLLKASNDDRNYLRKQLEKLEWYMLLSILRNNASHSDGINVPFKFPEFMSQSITSFTYLGIYVQKEMKSHSIQYQNIQLTELFYEMINFIKENEKLFTETNKGKVIVGLK